MFGVALEDAGAIAVRVGDDGVDRRAALIADGDLGAAAARALADVGASPADAVGIASAVPDAPLIVAAFAHLSQRYTRAAAPHGATPGGVAAVVAEWWRGAAQGVDDVVLFAVGVHAIGGVVRGGVPVSGARGRAGSVGLLRSSRGACRRR